MNPIQTFQIFGLEHYRMKKKCSGAKAIQDFEKYKVFEFLADGYDVLHTQSMNYILNEIVHYIDSKNETLSRKHAVH